jgi:hypothetical protein
VLEGEGSIRLSVLSSFSPVKLCCTSIVLTLTTNDYHDINVVIQFLYDAERVIAENILTLDHAWFQICNFAALLRQSV